jgi:hypothetical protein
MLRTLFGPGGEKADQMILDHARSRREGIVV